MSKPTLQDLCELGQQQLMRMDYLRAEATLMDAEKAAMAQEDYDTLSRLYMPLQESRRQRRQRCGEGIVCLDLLSNGPDDHVDGQHVVENFPHGQLLVAGWGTIEPGLRVRELQLQHGLYVETFLGAVYPVGEGRAVVIVPLADVAMPKPEPRSIDELIKLLPAHSIVLNQTELPEGSHRGTAETYARVMGLWERLHAPFLAAADLQVEVKQKIEGFRKTVRVDYACELAHQKLSDVARKIAREQRKRG